MAKLDQLQRNQAPKPQITTTNSVTIRRNFSKRKHQTGEQTMSTQLEGLNREVRSRSIQTIKRAQSGIDLRPKHLDENILVNLKNLQKSDQKASKTHNHFFTFITEKKPQPPEVKSLEQSLYKSRWSEADPFIRNAQSNGGSIYKIHRGRRSRQPSMQL